MKKVHIKLMGRRDDGEIYRLAISGKPQWECLVPATVISAGLKWAELANQCSFYWICISNQAVAYGLPK